MSTTKSAFKKSNAYRVSYTFKERLVGLSIMLSIMILIALVLMSNEAKEFFEKHVVIHGVATTARGIGPDTTVRILGIEAGNVQSVELTKNNKTNITMHISSKFHDRLRRDSRASITGLSLFGSSVIDITPGSPGQPILDNGSTMVIVEAASIEDLLGKFEPVIHSLEQAVTDASALIKTVNKEQVASGVDNYIRISQNLLDLTEHLKSANSTLGMALYDEDLQRTTRDTFDTAQTAVRHVSEKLPGLVSEVELSIAQVNLMLAVLNNELQLLPDLAIRTRTLLEESTQTLEGMQRVWPLSSTIEKPDKQLLLQAQPLNE